MHMVTSTGPAGPLREEDVMVVELSGAEARELKSTLDAVLHGLLNELAHTDQRAYRDELRERLARLEGVRRRLELHAVAEPAHG